MWQAKLHKWRHCRATRGRKKPVYWRLITVRFSIPGQKSKWKRTSINTFGIGRGCLTSAHFVCQRFWLSDCKLCRSGFKMHLKEAEWQHVCWGEHFCQEEGEEAAAPAMSFIAAVTFLKLPNSLSTYKSNSVFFSPLQAFEILRASAVVFFSLTLFLLVSFPYYSICLSTQSFLYHFPSYWMQDFVRNSQNNCHG